MSEIAFGAMGLGFSRFSRASLREPSTSLRLGASRVRYARWVTCVAGVIGLEPHISAMPQNPAAVQRMGPEPKRLISCYALHSNPSGQLRRSNIEHVHP